MRFSLFGLPIAPLVALIGCGAPVPTSGDVSADQDTRVTLRTERAAYGASLAGGEGSYRRYAVTLAAQLSNGLSVPLYLQRCDPDTPYPIYGVVSAEESREAGYNPVWACVGHGSPIVLPAVRPARIPCGSSDRTLGTAIPTSHSATSSVAFD